MGKNQASKRVLWISPYRTILPSQRAALEQSFGTTVKIIHSKPTHAKVIAAERELEDCHEVIITGLTVKLLMELQDLGITPIYVKMVEEPDPQKSETPLGRSGEIGLRFAGFYRVTLEIEHLVH